jgi:hypothetical protein
VSLENSDNTQKQVRHLQGMSKMVDIYTNPVLHEMQEVMLVRNYGKSVLDISPISAIVTAITM